MDPSCNVVTSPTLRFTSGSTRLPTAHVVSPVSHIYPLGQGFQHPHHLLHWCCRHLQTSLNEPPFNRKKAITTYMAGCKTHLQLQALLIPMPYLRRYKVSGMMPDILGQFVRYSSYSSLFIHRGITNVKFLQSVPASTAAAGASLLSFLASASPHVHERQRKPAVCDMHVAAAD